MAEKTFLDRLTTAIREREEKVKTYNQKQADKSEQMRLATVAKIDTKRKATQLSDAEMDKIVANRQAAEAESANNLLSESDVAMYDAEDAAYVKEDKGQIDFDKEFTVDLTDMGRTEGMENMASDTFGGGVLNTEAVVTKPLAGPNDNVSTTIEAPAPVGEKARFDGAAILDEADIARRSEVPADKLAELFKKTHGGSFDPKSKVDKAKMATITSMIGENRDLLNLSPTQFALKVYARKK